MDASDVTPSDRGALLAAGLPIPAALPLLSAGWTVIDILSVRTILAGPVRGPLAMRQDADRVLAESVLPLLNAGLTVADLAEFPAPYDVRSAAGAVAAGLDRDQVMTVLRTGTPFANVVAFIELGLPPAHAVTCADVDTPDTLRSILEYGFPLDDVITLLDEAGALHGAMRVRKAVNVTTPSDVRVLAAHLASNTLTRPSLCVTAAREAVGTPWAQTLRTFASDGMPLTAAVDAARALESLDPTPAGGAGQLASDRSVRVTPTADSPARVRTVR